MIIYRPHRGGLKESMEEKREFPSIDEMLDYIVKQNTDEERGPAFSVEDIVLGDESFPDPRIGWKDCRRVCVMRYYSEVYDFPTCIGHYATDYE